MARSFHTFDVFTDRAYAGNPLAIVPDADGLDDAAMQAIAREFNLSETVFVLPPEKPGHTAALRIFTPGGELPFAGHPTIGTAIFLALQKYGAVEREEDAIMMLEEGVGPVRVGVRLRPDEPAFAEFDAPQLPREVGPAADKDTIAAALGIAAGEVGFENHAPTVFTAGNAFNFVPLRNLDTMARVALMPHHWPSAFTKKGSPAAFLYTRETVCHDAAFHARMFWPALGIGEDPATGAAAAALAGVVMRFDTPLDGVHVGTIEQGFEMGRPSSMSLEMEVTGGALHSVRIGGTAVPVMRGDLLD